MRLTKNPWVFVIGAIAVLSLISIGCSSDDEGTPNPVGGTTYPPGSLVSVPASATPSDDATVDALWGSVTGLSISTVVPAYTFLDASGNDIWWDNYEGMTIDVTLKSVYTANYIYLLAEWNDAEEPLLRQAWYYNPAGPKWLQMGKKYPDEFGNDPAYEDKFSMFWNMSVAGFETTGCSPFCHGPYMGTNNAGETMDIWHWKRDRTGPVSQLDDKWLDNAQNGRHSDAGTGAYASNFQALVTTSFGTVDAPKYWIPNRQNYHWILQSEITDGTAKLIVDMDANGNFIDEASNVLDKTQHGFLSPLCVPSLIEIKPATGSRGDVSVWHNWSNGMWTLKIKRLRNTGNSDDLQFTQTGTPYWFSIGVMNAAAIAHAIPGGFTGTAYAMYLAE